MMRWTRQSLTKLDTQLICHKVVRPYIGCKWILKRKLKPDDSIEKYKALLIAKGFRQKNNINVFDTYSPMTRLTSIHVLIALANIHNFVIHQMDLKTAFLNGDLDEKIYTD